MTPQLLSSDNVRLRPMEASDLPLIYKLENDTRLWNTAANTQPLSRSTIEKYIGASTGDIYKDGQLRLIIESKTSSVQEFKSIGVIDLIDFSPRHQRAEVGISILPEYQSQRIGTEALRLMEQYAAQVLFIHQLYAYVDPNNEISLRLFTSAGYQRVGTLQDWLKTSEGYKHILLFQKIFS
ncbi:MAG: GNAT family N-acetyltransferase [Bacteroidaceae bacterium]|nr:GNAT family N-acetyltransferase [Bacteroidaceae bacterium]